MKPIDHIRDPRIPYDLLITRSHKVGQTKTQMLEQELKNTWFGDVITYLNKTKDGRVARFMDHDIDLNPWIDGLLDSACDCALCDIYTRDTISFTFSEDDFLLDFTNWDSYVKDYSGVACVLDDTICKSWGFTDKLENLIYEDMRFREMIQAISLRLAYNWIVMTVNCKDL